MLIQPMRNLSLIHKMCTFFSYVHLILNNNLRGIFVVLAERYMPRLILSTRPSPSLYFYWNTQHLAVYSFEILQIWLVLHDTHGKLSLAMLIEQETCPWRCTPTNIYSVDNELNNESISRRNLKEVEIFFFSTETVSYYPNFV